jgi:hypothetical protein
MRGCARTRRRETFAASDDEKGLRRKGPRCSSQTGPKQGAQRFGGLSARPPGKVARYSAPENQKGPPGATSGRSKLRGTRSATQMRSAETQDGRGLSPLPSSGDRDLGGPGLRNGRHKCSDVDESWLRLSERFSANEQQKDARAISSALSPRVESFLPTLAFASYRPETAIPPSAKTFITYFAGFLTGREAAWLESGRPNRKRSLAPP